MKKLAQGLYRATSPPPTVELFWAPIPLGNMETPEALLSWASTLNGQSKRLQLTLLPHRQPAGFIGVQSGAAQSPADSIDHWPILQDLDVVTAERESALVR